jgi:hypothetical protein
VQTASQDDEEDDSFELELQVEGEKGLREVSVSSDITYKRFCKRMAQLMGVTDVEDVELAWSCNLTPVKQWSKPRIIESAGSLKKLIALAADVQSGAQKVPKGKKFEITIHNLFHDTKGKGKSKSGQGKVRVPAASSDRC